MTKLLLADELSLGLAPMIVDRLLSAVRTAADEQGRLELLSLNSMLERH